MCAVYYLLYSTCMRCCCKACLKNMKKWNNLERECCMQSSLVLVEHIQLCTMYARKEFIHIAVTICIDCNCHLQLARPNFPCLEGIRESCQRNLLRLIVDCALFQLVLVYG